jgi:hypothetical protein
VETIGKTRSWLLETIKKIGETLASLAKAERGSEAGGEGEDTD